MKFLGWAKGIGELERVGIEGSGSFGAGLSRFLNKHGVEVLEVGRPKRRDQHRSGKSDPIDAEIAARTVLSGTDIGETKGTEGRVEMIRVLRAARRSAVKARAQAANQLKAMLITAPEGLRAELRKLSTTKLVRKAASFRPGDVPGDVAAATKSALRSIVRRYLDLSEEIRELDGQLKRLVTETAPDLVAVHGIGVDTAATLLVAVGEDPKRLRSESAFAHMCGVAPIPASSGKVVRYRLNRRGNRDANRALHIVAAERMSRDERTREYVVKRTSEGKSKREIMRCLKRYIAREVYRILTQTVVLTGVAGREYPDARRELGRHIHNGLASRRQPLSQVLTETTGVLYGPPTLGKPLHPAFKGSQAGTVLRESNALDELAALIHRRESDGRLMWIDADQHFHARTSFWSNLRFACAKDTPTLSSTYLF